MDADKKLDNYKSFFADQIREAVEEQQKINKSAMRTLFKSGDLSLAYIDSVQNDTGYVIIKCPRGMAPRLKVQKCLTVIKKSAFDKYGARPLEWNCKWETFCADPNLHSAGTDFTPMYYVNKGDSSYDYIACTGISSTLYDLFRKSSEAGKSLSLIIYNPFPPTDYYKNLSFFIDGNRGNQDLLTEPSINYDDWQPEELAFNQESPDAISDRILNTLGNEGTCIVQGPPGTGKSYTIASIIAHYLLEGKRVCVTTMANKGLIELVKQPPLNKYLTSSKISKTNLSADERKQVVGLKLANSNLQVLEGELLCATNYVLSSAFNPEKIALNGIPQYDLIVIEEASQAFLTAIVAFKSLGKHCLIVGDPMQLPPIVKLNNPLYNSWNVNPQIEGLKSIALGSDIKSYRIVTTFRLTNKSANLTKYFYGNRFVSVKSEYLDFTKIDDPIFPTEGGVIYYCTNDLCNGFYSNSCNMLLHRVISNLEKYYPHYKIALISPYRDSVREMQKYFSSPDINLDITIETIDRIQGMTVDYAVLYLPGRNPGFALEERRFNVATSRSRSTTLIISDMPIEDIHSVSPLVKLFISHCEILNHNGSVCKPMLCKSKIQSPEAMSPVIESCSHIPGVKVVGKIDLSRFEKKKIEIQPTKKNYYIIDTNVFINYPEILSKINVQYPIILSAKVIDELDKMKIRSEQAKKNAETALRLLNRENRQKIIFETSNVSLLPPDYDRRSPDNLILSVALKYKDENPIMMTSDNGLQLKCKALGITTITLKAYLKQLKH